MEQRRNSMGGDPRESPTDQRHRPALFLHAKIRERLRWESNPVRLVLEARCSSPSSELPEAAGLPVEIVDAPQHGAQARLDHAPEIFEIGVMPAQSKRVMSLLPRNHPTMQPDLFMPFTRKIYSSRMMHHAISPSSPELFRGAVCRVSTTAVATSFAPCEHHRAFVGHGGEDLWFIYLRPASPCNRLASLPPSPTPGAFAMAFWEISGIRTSHQSIMMKCEVTLRTQDPLTYREQGAVGSCPEGAVGNSEKGHTEKRHQYFLGKKSYQWATRGKTTPAREVEGGVYHPLAAIEDPADTRALGKHPRATSRCPHSSGVGWPTCSQRVEGSRPGASDTADLQIACRTGNLSALPKIAYKAFDCNRKLFIALKWRGDLEVHPVIRSEHIAAVIRDIESCCGVSHSHVKCRASSEIDPNRIICWKTFPVHEGKTDNTGVISISSDVSMYSCKKMKMELDIWTALNSEIFRADEGDIGEFGAGMKGRAKWEIPEKTRRPTASSTCENLVARLGIELSSPWWEGHGGLLVRLLTSQIGEPGSILGGIALGFSHVQIVPDDAAGRRIFSGTSRFPRPCIPVLLHTHFTSPSSVSQDLDAKGHPNLSSSLARRASLVQGRRAESVTHGAVRAKCCGSATSSSSFWFVYSSENFQRRPGVRRQQSGEPAKRVAARVNSWSEVCGLRASHLPVFVAHGGPCKTAFGARFVKTGPRVSRVAPGPDNALDPWAQPPPPPFLDSIRADLLLIIAPHPRTTPKGVRRVRNICAIRLKVKSLQQKRHRYVNESYVNNTLVIPDGSVVVSSEGAGTSNEVVYIERDVAPADELLCDSFVLNQLGGRARATPASLAGDEVPTADEMADRHQHV
ncbi:hypothetical protein PR048_008233 [Dryococelus australis]|uniref:Uncharacterized protein n=1 Tax=Dryococelus australis TaxID=614101 RepID=A0ABQ9HXB3_9NEOP|nr:hypothetical protein PR048_008233 [Dryococelus australis]